MGGGRKGPRSRRRATRRPFCPGVLIVSDRDTWVNDAIGLVRSVGGVPERVTWRDAGRVVTLHEALLFDVTEPFEAKARLLRRWAAQGLHHVGICCLSPAPGAAPLKLELEGMGYDIAPPKTIEEPDWSRVKRTLQAIRGSQTWIAVAVAQAIDCLEEEIMQALSVAVGTDTGFRTVRRWADALGLPPVALYRVFRRNAVSARPKRVIDSVRLLRLAASRSSGSGRRSHEDPLDRTTATRRDTSRASLARWVKNKTGVTLRRFTGFGLDEAVELVSEFLRRDVSR